MNKVLVLHFTHPEGYPPALNAINCLAEKVDALKIITTDTLPTKWNYAKNVEYEFVEGEYDRFNFVNKPAWVKLKRYFQFVSLIRKTIKKNKPTLVLIYDNVPFLLYLFASIFTIRNYKLWYHNHDIYPLSQYAKYSINWFSFLAIQKFFDRIDYFSIPSMERKRMFPMEEFKGKFFFIPNYPSQKIIKSTVLKTTDWAGEKELRIVYPGSPSIKNGFEELLEFISTNNLEKRVTLTIVGETNKGYKSELTTYAKHKGVEENLRFVERVPYTEMPQFLSHYHIGWAMYKPMDMRTETVATASNKIYEFLANAMPIIVFDNDHHRQHLQQTKSVFFCDLTNNSISTVINKINEDYIHLSTEALNEFKLKYQFENSFNKVIGEILNHDTKVQ